MVSVKYNNKVYCCYSALSRYNDVNVFDLSVFYEMRVSHNRLI